MNSQTKDVAVSEETNVISAELAMVERILTNKDADAAKLDAYMKWRDQLRREETELRLEQAMINFNESMRDAQAAMSHISTDSENPQTNSKYASLSAVIREAKPIYTQAGFSVSFNEEEPAPEGFVRVIAIVANGLHERTYYYNSPIVLTGIQGKVNMTATHGRSSAVSYARRYLLGMIFNLSIGRDDDGNAAGKTPISAEQVAELDKLLTETKASRPRFLKWAKVKALEEIDVTAYDGCVEAIQQAAAAKTKPVE